MTKICLSLFLLFCIAKMVRAQEEPPYRMAASWWVEGDTVRISYDLFVPLDKTYDVRVVLKRESDSTFAMIPVAVNGAIGKVHFNGGTLDINWDYKKDVQGELKGKYKFDFVVTEIEEGSGMQWWHYVAGGAAVIAGVYAVIKSGKEDAATTLPGPPNIRP